MANRQVVYRLRRAQNAEASPRVPVPFGKVEGKLDSYNVGPNRGVIVPDSGEPVFVRLAAFTDVGIFDPVNLTGTRLAFDIALEGDRHYAVNLEPLRG